MSAIKPRHETRRDITRECPFVNLLLRYYSFYNDEVIVPRLVLARYRLTSACSLLEIIRAQRAGYLTSSPRRDPSSSDIDYLNTRVYV